MQKPSSPLWCQHANIWDKLWGLLLSDCSPSALQCILNLRASAWAWATESSLRRDWRTSRKIWPTSGLLQGSIVPLSVLNTAFLSYPCIAGIYNSPSAGVYDGCWETWIQWNVLMFGLKAPQVHGSWANFSRRELFSQSDRFTRTRLK